MDQSIKWIGNLFDGLIHFILQFMLIYKKNAMGYDELIKLVDGHKNTQTIIH